jgi:hypothetical protein
MMITLKDRFLLLKSAIQFFHLFLPIVAKSEQLVHSPNMSEEQNPPA